MTASVVTAADTVPRPGLAERFDRHAGRFMVLPAVIVLLCFAIFPLIISAYLSLSRFALAPGGFTLKFVGLFNFKKLLTGSQQYHLLGTFGRLRNSAVDHRRRRRGADPVPTGALSLLRPRHDLRHHRAPDHGEPGDGAGTAPHRNDPRWRRARHDGDDADLCRRRRHRAVPARPRASPCSAPRLSADATSSACSSSCR